MRNSYTFPMRIPVIKVSQPLSDFYVASISAKLLLDVSYTIRAEILNDDEDDYENSRINHIGRFINKISGNQRERTSKRLEEIKRYSETVDASFPNSIVIGANYDENGKLISDPEKRWRIECNSNGAYELVIPTSEKLASIIDGQHRVFGFAASKAINMELPCSVYIDLPLAYHARIFTNININQKRVDKNLAYNLFQFDMEQGDAATWSPETLAVYIARVLARDVDSPLKDNIKLGIENGLSHSSISMASVIDGILSLITTDPKLDRETLHQVSIKDGRDRSSLNDIGSSAPLRRAFIEKQDKTIYDLIVNMFESVKDNLWQYDVFRKTLGVQALFDVLKILCVEHDTHLMDKAFFDRIFSSCSDINYLDDFFGIQTKLRARLRNVILICSEYRRINELRIKDSELDDYIKILKDKGD